MCSSGYVSPQVEEGLSSSIFTFITIGVSVDNWHICRCSQLAHLSPIYLEQRSLICCTRNFKLIN
jgi:hypothetical protein